MKTLVLIGDSIRLGYSPFVEASLAGRASVRQIEMNGGDSNNVLAHLAEWINPKPDAIHVNCGLHDIKKALNSSDAQVPLDKYRDNVRKILEACLASGAPTVWATTTPVIEEWHTRTKGFCRYEADVAAYNAAASEVARGLGVPIDDLFAVMRDAGPETHLIHDGVHFKPEGSKVLAEAVVRAVEGYL